MQWNVCETILNNEQRTTNDAEAFDRTLNFLILSLHQILHYLY